MKRYVLILPVIVLSLAFFSCEQTTGSDKYDAVWSPSGDANNTKWTRPASVTNFSQFDRGISFTATAIKDSTVSLTFSPQIYQVANITTASSATISFTASLTSLPDSVLRTDGSKVTHQFGVLGGTISTSGDSVAFSVKPFTAGVSNSLSLSVNPDSCSKLLRFNIALSWNNFTNGTPAGALPTTKSVDVSIKDITMRVNGIDVIR